MPEVIETIQLERARLGQKTGKEQNAIAVHRELPDLQRLREHAGIVSRFSGLLARSTIQPYGIFRRQNSNVNGTHVGE